ncbi:class A beta-lactamase [Hymenobacter negativus]|uniref:Beta-lactamase n=1 Tax=Hymenobacter negativus TaxID=2795026 RepID=A0ABS3QLR4_9BACT|nr:class A beta-lactamase [Hymenobacter negativus]MBO2012209.1 class A beta-lactamase [Hymenobacter negativus]
MLKHFLLASALALAISPAQAQHTALRATIAHLAGESSAKVGVALRVLETNDTLSYHNRQHYPMLSVFKLAIAMQVLHEVDRGHLHLDQQQLLTKTDLLGNTHSPLRDKYPDGNVRVSIQELLTYMVTLSDNNACDILLKLVGGPTALTAYVRRLGVQPFVAEVSEAKMGAVWANQYRNWSYPSTQVDLLARVYYQTALSKTSSTLLWQLLLDTSVGPKRIKGLLPASTPVAHRTGTSGTNAQGLSPALNDAGIIALPNGQHVALTVFVADSHADTAARELLIATIARAVYDEFVPPPSPITP